MKNRYFRTVFIAMLIFVAILAMAGCHGVTDGVLPAQAATQVVYSSTPPLVVAILQDETGSTTWTRTPTLTIGELEPVIQLLQRSGGELGLGLIRDQSNRGFLRLRIDPPPTITAPPSKTERPFEDARRMQRYRKQIASEEEAFHEWKVRGDAAIRLFRESAKDLLEQAPDAPRTDVCGAIKRADAMLSEPGLSWPEPPHRWLIAITDGQDNAKKCSPVATLKSNAKLLAINGNGDVGSVGGLNAQVFESPKAAMAFVVAAETERRK